MDCAEFSVSAKAWAESVRAAALGKDARDPRLIWWVVWDGKELALHCRHGPCLSVHIPVPCLSVFDPRRGDAPVMWRVTHSQVLARASALARRSAVLGLVVPLSSEPVAAAEIWWPWVRGFGSRLTLPVSCGFFVPMEIVRQRLRRHTVARVTATRDELVEALKRLCVRGAITRAWLTSSGWGVRAILGVEYDQRGVMSSPVGRLCQVVLPGAQALRPQRLLQALCACQPGPVSLSVCYCAEDSYAGLEQRGRLVLMGAW